MDIEKRRLVAEIDNELRKLAERAVAGGISRSSFEQAAADAHDKAKWEDNGDEYADWRARMR